jgi:hypothetical protein
MRIGVVSPTLEVADPGAVRDYAQAAEDLGYAHLTAWEHVVGVDPRSCGPCSPRRWSPSPATGTTWRRLGSRRCRRRPIPIWIGGQADAALRRVAALGEGWLPMIGPEDGQRDGCISRLHRYAQDRGRDPASLGIDPILSLAHGGPTPDGTASLRTQEEWMSDLEAWQALGATHLTVNTMGAGLSVQEHLDATGRFKEVVEAAPQP